MGRQTKPTREKPVAKASPRKIKNASGRLMRLFRQYEIAFNNHSARQSTILEQIQDVAGKIGSSLDERDPKKSGVMPAAAPGEAPAS